MPDFGVAEAEKALETIFAPWIVALGLKPTGFDASGGTFVLPENPALAQIGGVICGQATTSAADTASVVTLAALNGRLRMCTTVDLTTHFIRPLKPGNVDIRVDVLSNGRRMAYTRVEMRAEGDERIAVTSTATFAYLED
ncbi:PaaI family thioesterase [Aerobium aerolatum]|uniref:Acyl-coenzyme A thioesterase PaaI, contains HGG motif n=1 Tax=Aquamicrobium aerolatum DSM 21857 TaxID=1121003 RepID=A0A1I3MC51_9HYPH|nr:PaaI family thioesterase [Aquamicrobium aerolatum]SFI94295.1 Acyl-coenzyme A thioesterase PaaI, contains HGG motif [Aquamicrobium aerolatum DSM 21857]